MHEILQYLKIHGERIDIEIAAGVGISLAKVRVHLSELSAKGDVMSCHTIKFVDGKKIEGMSYRLAGFVLKAKPGAKSKVQLKLT
ncbi:MAG: hypothetical protein FD173_548 [Gallionellaceae bacterium]|nr:MAG: hypothetical protein FD173_548 [Gallionellaceae bacterium]